MAAPIGNQNAAKGKRWQKALERVLARKYGDVDTGLEHLAEQFVALADNPDAAKDVCRDVADRFDGKPNQSISGPDGGSVPLSVGVTFVGTTPGKVSE